MSVRDRSEWHLAHQLGVGIIDFKEPSRGPLSATNPDLWRWAVDQRVTHAELSAALGERKDALELAQQVPPQFRFAKVGPSGCETTEQLTAMWTAVQSRLNPNVELVAVSYADYQNAGCVGVEQILESARSYGFQHVLIDTFAKDGRSTVDHLGFDRLRAISRWATEHKIWWALAGSIKLANVGELSDHHIFPHCFGVRGDVCDDLRTGTLCKQKIQNWVSVMKSMTRVVE